MREKPSWRQPDYLLSFFSVHGEHDSSFHTLIHWSEGEDKSMPRTLIKIEALSRVIRRGATEVKVLDDINLEVEEGDFLALMGPSGSGKTTLIKIIAGVDRPTSGRVQVDNVAIHGMSKKALAAWRNRSVGFIFRASNLIPVLTIFENVELPLLLTSASRQQRRERVLTVLSHLGVSDRANHYPHQLSAGQEQKVSIARALATDAPLILADEPTGDLDAHSAEETLTWLVQLPSAFGKTILMATHDAGVAKYAPSIRHLNKGVLLESEARGGRGHEVSAVY